MKPLAHLKTLPRVLAVCGGVLAFLSCGFSSRVLAAGKIAYHTESADGSTPAQIYLINPDGTGNTRISPPTEYSHNAALSPDGSTIAYNFYADGQGESVKLVNPDGTGSTALSLTSDFFRPVWSPDGTRLAAIENSFTRTGVVLFDKAGSNKTRLPEGTNIVPNNVAWSPDGTRVIFDAFISGVAGLRLYVLNVDGSNNPQPITPDTGSAYEYPSYSSDGARILCTKDQNLTILDAATGAETFVIGLAQSPTWSPDGTQIAYTSTSSSTDGALFIVNADGTNNHQIAAGTVHLPKWSAAGGSLPPDGTLTVPGTSNLWLAGAAPGTTASSGQDTLTNATPFQVPNLTLVPGQSMTFSATGNVSNDPANPVTFGPDGGPYLGFTLYKHEKENGIADLTAPVNSLVGVFLDASTPNPLTAPDGYDLSQPPGVDYTLIAPALRKPFFIGDGKTTDGTVQKILVPTGATRLFLGSLDPSDQKNNTGSFIVKINGGGGGTTGVALAVTDTTRTSVSDPSGDTAIPNDRVTFAFTVRNTGDADATNVVAKVGLNGIKFKQASDDGAFDGNFVTWNLGTLAAKASRTLTVTGKLPANFPLDGRTAGFTITGVTADAPTVAIPTQDNGFFTVRPPYQLDVASFSSIAPNGLLTYHFTFTNRSNKPAADAFAIVQVPDKVNFVSAYFTDAGGNPIPGTNAKENGSGNLVFNLGTVAAGNIATFDVNVRIPADDASGTAITLLSTHVVVDGTADTVGNVTGGTTYNEPGSLVTVSNDPASDPPKVAIVKHVVDVYTLADLFINNPKRALPLAAAIGTLYPNFGDFYVPDPNDPSKTIANVDTVAKLAQKVNPYVGDDSTGSATGDDILTVGSPTGSRPNPFVTFALFYDNSGASKAEDIVITDRVPEGFVFDPNLTSDPKAFLPAVVLVNGKASTPKNFTLADNGRTLIFNVGKVKPGTPGLILYQLRLLSPSSGGPNIGAIVDTSSARLDTSSLSGTLYSNPLTGIPLLVVGPFHAFVEPQNNGSYSRIGDTVRYTLFYKNDGTKKASNFLVRSNVPAGTTFVHAALLADDGQTERAAGPGELSAPNAPDADGSITFNLGELKKNRSGFVAVDFKLGAALLTQSRPLVQATFQAGDSDVTGNFVTFGTRPRPVTRALAHGPRPRANGANTPGVSEVSTSTRVTDPSLPRVFIAKVAPMAVLPDTDYDEVILVGNVGDKTVGYSGNGSAITELLPPGVTVRAIKSDFPNTGAVPDGSNRLQLVLPPLARSAVTTIKLTLRAPASALNTTLVSPYCAVDGIERFPTLYTGPSKTRVVRNASELAVQAGSIASDMLSRYGVTNTVAPRLPQNLTLGSRSITYAGADAVTFNNGTLLIPVRSGAVVLIGTNNTVGVPVGFASTVRTSNGTVVTYASAEDLSVRNLRDGSTVVVDDNGRDLRTVLNQIVSGNADNLVHRRVASIEVAGALNLVGLDGKTFVSNEPNPPAPVAIQLGRTLAVGGLAAPAGVANAQLVLDGKLTLQTLNGSNQLVAAGAGNLVAAGAGNLVAAGAGNLVAAGAGNLVAAGAGNLIAAGAGNAVPTPVLSASALISQDGSGLIGDGGLGLISQDGAGIVSHDGGGLISDNGLGRSGN